MVRILYLHVETAGMSSKSMKILGAALSIALGNGGIQEHRLPIADFCAIADIPISSGVRDLNKFIATDGRGALGLLSAVRVDLDAGEIIDDVPRYRGSWPLFNYMHVDSEYFFFEVGRKYLREVLASLRLGGPVHVRRLLQDGESFH